jgi:hypothetical protein
MQFFHQTLRQQPGNKCERNLGRTSPAGKPKDARENGWVLGAFTRLIGALIYSNRACTLHHRPSPNRENDDARTSRPADHAAARHDSSRSPVGKPGPTRRSRPGTVRSRIKREPRRRVIWSCFVTLADAMSRAGITPKEAALYLDFAQTNKNLRLFGAAKMP